MKTLFFKDIEIGKEFIYQNITYKKIDPEKITCCKSNNAVSKDDANRKVSMHPMLQVEVIDEPQ